MDRPDGTCRYIVAIDPGKMTGYALYDREEGKFSSYETSFDDTCRYLASHAATWKEDLLIVSESFIITVQTAKNTQSPWSLELIGVARYISRALTGRDLILQAPATAKRFASDDRLKTMGWHVPGKGHANDAARHLLLTLATRGWLSQDKLKELATSAE